MSRTAAAAELRPDIDPALVYAFDIYNDPTIRADVHAGYLKLKQSAPPVFWTPENGGHWMVTTADGVIEVLRHPETFSSRFLSIPPNPNQPHMIPESLDPPEHRPYRQMLRPFFESKAIEPLQPRIDAWTSKLIDAVAEDGKCEFIGALGSRLPVSVFMEMFGFPLDRFEEFRGLVVDYFATQSTPEERAAMAGQIQGILAELINARMAEPRDDLISRIIATEIEGRRLRFDELMSIGFLMFLAGLDTVTNAMTFGMRHLAGDAALRQRMIDDPACIPHAIEELLRRYTFVAVPRYLARDTELLGVKLRAGDSIVAPLMMVGWDARLTPNPEAVSVDRAAYKHAAFGSGIHTCLGLHLARMELATFYRHWFARIGHFRLADPDAPLVTRGGSVMALETLHIVWGD